MYPNVSFFNTPQDSIASAIQLLKNNVERWKELSEQIDPNTAKAILFASDSNAAKEIAEKIAEKGQCQAAIFQFSNNFEKLLQRENILQATEFGTEIFNSGDQNTDANLVDLIKATDDFFCKLSQAFGAQIRGGVAGNQEYPQKQVKIATNSILRVVSRFNPESDNATLLSNRQTN